MLIQLDFLGGGNLVVCQHSVLSSDMNANSFCMKLFVHLRIDCSKLLSWMRLAQEYTCIHWFTPCLPSMHRSWIMDELAGEQAESLIVSLNFGLAKVFWWIVFDASQHWPLKIFKISIAFSLFDAAFLFSRIKLSEMRKFLKVDLEFQNAVKNDVYVHKWICSKHGTMHC